MALASHNKDFHRHLLRISRTPMFERKEVAATRLPTSLKGSPDPTEMLAHPKRVLGSRSTRPGLGSCGCVGRKEGKKMSRHQGGWAQTTARVLSHVLMVSRVAERTITAQDQAAIDKVWAHVGVRRDEYDDSGQWKKVALERREGVRQRLFYGFRDAFRALDPEVLGRSDVAGAAFLPGGRASRAGQARREFKRAHLLDWGNRLLAAEAANVAPPPPPPPSAAEAAAASVANESSDEDSTDPDTAISLTIASLPEDIRSTVEGIMERAATAGYELSDWDELLRYARRRKVEAAVLNAGDSESYSRAANELGAVNAAWERVMPPAAPSQFDEHDSKSQAGGESVFSFSGLSFVSRGEALQHLHRDMIDNRVSVDNIPGLKKKKKKKKLPVKKAIAKDFNNFGKKIRKAFNIP